MEDTTTHGMAIGIYSYTCILTNHSTHSSITTTTTPSTTSYPYALTMVVRHVSLCVLVSVAMGIPLWVYVLVGVLVL